MTDLWTKPDTLLLPNGIAVVEICFERLDAKGLVQLYTEHLPDFCPPKEFQVPAARGLHFPRAMRLVRSFRKVGATIIDVMIDHCMLESPLRLQPITHLPHRTAQ